MEDHSVVDEELLWKGHTRWKSNGLMHCFFLFGGSNWACSIGKFPPAMLERLGRN